MSDSDLSLFHSSACDVDEAHLKPSRPDRHAELSSLYGDVEALSPQVRRVLSLLVDGCSNKEIAWRLSLKETTIKSHMSAIMRALRCKSRTQAALIALCLTCNLASHEARVRATIASRD